MSNIKILTDSTSDLDEKTRQQYNINMIPLNVYFGDKGFKDGKDLLPEEFYKKLTSDPNHPKTSQPTPEDFKKKYAELLQDGSEIISLHVSSKMSGTVQSAQIAKNELNNDKIHIIDSEYVSFILGSMAIETAKAIKANKSVTEIKEMIENLKKEIKVYIIVDTLVYLQKGGRIGKAASLIGGLLNIKPILTIKEGQICPFEKIRGSKKVIGRMSGLYKEYLDRSENKNVSLVLGHTTAPDKANRLLEKIKEYHENPNVLIFQIGSVVGSHAGPGTLAICFYPAVN